MPSSSTGIAPILSRISGETDRAYQERTDSFNQYWTNPVKGQDRYSQEDFIAWKAANPSAARNSYYRPEVFKDPRTLGRRTASPIYDSQYYPGGKTYYLEDYLNWRDEGRDRQDDYLYTPEQFRNPELLYRRPRGGSGGFLSPEEIKQQRAQAAEAERQSLLQPWNPFTTPPTSPNPVVRPGPGGGGAYGPGGAFSSGDDGSGGGASATSDGGGAWSGIAPDGTFSDDESDREKYQRVIDELNKRLRARKSARGDEGRGEYLRELQSPQPSIAPSIVDPRQPLPRETPMLGRRWRPSLGASDTSGGGVLSGNGDAPSGDQNPSLRFKNGNGIADEGVMAGKMRGRKSSGKSGQKRGFVRRMIKF